MNSAADKCKKISPGDYEYRGFPVYVNPSMQPGYMGRWHVGLGQQVHSEATREDCIRWIDNQLAAPRCGLIGNHHEPVHQ